MFIGIVLVVLLLTGCSEEFVPANDTGETNIEDVVNGNNQFAFDLYSQLSGDNVFFSPYSISSALAMTYEGAEGETKEQMKDVLGFVDDSSVMRSSFASLYIL